MKKKAKEQVAGGLTEMHAAIAALETADDLKDQPTIGESEAPNEVSAKVAKAKSGQIGEGKSATLTKAQRKRALCVSTTQYSSYVEADHVVFVVL